MSQAAPKDSSRIRGDARARRFQRQQEALARQNDHDSRTPEDQIARLESRRGDSARERDKLLKVIEQRGKLTKKDKR